MYRKHNYYLIIDELMSMATIMLFVGLSSVSISSQKEVIYPKIKCCKIQEKCSPPSKHLQGVKFEWG